jgi:penicillin-binding protein-related factor A (putative recombinase)
MSTPNLGKIAEARLQTWLDHPEKGYCLDRIKDQMSMFAHSTNICDYTLFKAPYFYYIECKETKTDRFDFSKINGFPDGDFKTQFGGLLEKSKIANVFAVIVVCFSTYKRSFIFDINEIDRIYKSDRKSININDIGSSDIRYREIEIVHNKRKKYLDFDYRGEFEL